MMVESVHQNCVMGRCANLHIHILLQLLIAYPDLLVVVYKILHPSQKQASAYYSFIIPISLFLSV